MTEEMCYISKVRSKESSARPIILNFENGVVQAGQEHKIACQLYKRKHNTLLAAATKSMIYTGDVTRDEMYNTFIGLIDKKTNKTSLIALDQARMSPWFKESKTLDISIEEKASSIGELNKVFGSKRIKRQTEQHQRMKLDIENVKEQLEQTVADVHVDVKDMVAPSADNVENEAQYKPKINRDAERIEDIYLIEDLVSSTVLNSVSEEVERIFVNPSDSWGTTELVKQQLNKLVKLESSSTEQTCQLLLYIDCLIKFMLESAKNVTKKTYVACSYSDVVHGDILKKFTVVTGNTRSRPNIMRDKCLCYILVLSIIACRNNLSLGSYSKELKIGLKKIQDVCRILAFTVLKESACLKLPLPPPVSLHTRSKKKK